MVHKFLRIAGVKTKGEFYKKYPSEAAFFKAHPEARKMAEGGAMQDPSQGGGQEQQMVQQIAQALQQGAQPEEVMQQLVQMGMPQEQAMQIIQAVMEQMQGGQPAPQQPGMMYGGSLPYAAYGMTLPNIENYPSYDTYKAAYNQYLTDIDTTTTLDPAGDVIDYSRYANDSIYNNPTVDTFAQRINQGLIGKDDTTGNITPDRSNNGVSTLRPDAALQAEMDEEANKDSPGGGWFWPALGGATGLAALRYAVYPAGKGVYKFGQKRLGETPEIDQSKLTPEQQKMNERRVSQYKLTIDNRGYTVGKRDVNELVSRGMSRADAQAYVDQLPDKSGKSKSTAPSSTTTPDNIAPASETSSAFDFSNINDIEDLVNYDYHRERLQESKDKGSADPYHTDMLNKDPKTYLEEHIVYAQTKLQENLGTSREAFFRDEVEKTKAKLKRLSEIAPDAVAPGVNSVRGSATVTSSTSNTSGTTGTEGTTSEQTNVPASGTEGTTTGTAPATEKKAVTPKTPTEKPSAEKINKTKELIKFQQEAKKQGKTPAQILREAKEKGLIENVVGGYRGVRPNPDKAEDITTYGRKRGQLKEKRKQKIEEKIKEGKIKLAMGGYVPEYAAQAYGAYDLPEFEMGSFYEHGGAWNGTWNGNQGFAYGGSNPFEDNPLRRFVYAEGGMSPEEAMMMQQQQAAPQEQSGGGEMEQIVEAVVTMFEQGMQPEEVMQKLMQAGLPQEIVQQVVQYVMEQQQAGGGQEMPQQAPQEQMMQEQMMQGQEAPMQGEMPMRMYGGGDSFGYGGSSLHKFVNGGQPQIGQEMDVTPEQLEQLRMQGIQFKIIK